MVLSALITGIVTLLGYLLFLGYRTDYAGHYLATYAATLITAAVLFRLFGKHPFVNLLSAVLLMLFGIYMEAVVFRLAIFDPVDYLNQNLGACVAAITLLGGQATTRSLVGLGVLGAVLLKLGFYIAFL